MLQFSFAAHDFLYLYTHIRFSVNKPNFHFKGKGRISTDGFNKINLSILQFNILNFQIKQFVIYQKFLWNSVQTIWSVIMNSTEIIYRKMKSVIQNVREKGGSLCLQVKTKQKQSLRNSGRSMLNQPKEVLCICVPFQESRDTIKEQPETSIYLYVFIILEKTLKQFKF